MDWKVVKAKNGLNTLTCNGQYIYSKYNPLKDAHKFIVQNMDENATEYILLGLGLGYHLEALINNSGNKNVYILVIDKKELELFNNFSLNKELLKSNNVVLVDGNINIDFHQDSQVLIPFSILNILPDNHRLKLLLEKIKLTQMSFNLNKERLEKNLDINLKLNDNNCGSLENLFVNKIACLVSSGPSIDDVLPYLAQFKEKCFILCVGSALRILLNHGITPHAVIISDAKEAVRYQFLNINYSGPLFYLITSAHEVVQNHKGKRYCLFQKGYPASEEVATKLGVKAIEVGGSVATAGFSLLELLGFKEIILCGQDLGFVNGKTHSTGTTSGVYINQPYEYRNVMANSGKLINITKSLNVYLQFFERKAQTSQARIINTAWNGTKINGVPYMHPKEIINDLEKEPKCKFEV